MAVGEVDAGQLRRALRAIHCLQRERGASGAYCASSEDAEAESERADDAARASTSNGGSGRTRFAPLATPGDPAGATNSSSHNASSLRMPLTTARVDTDRALERMAAHCGSAFNNNNASTTHSSNVVTTAQLTLHKIRAMMDRRNAGNSNDSPSAAAPSFRRILVSFSALISTVLHEFVLRYTLPAALGGSGNGNGGGGANPSHLRRGTGQSSASSSKAFPRVHSSENVFILQQKKQLQQRAAAKRAPAHRRSRSDGDEAGGSGGDNRHVVTATSGPASAALLQHYSSDPSHYVFDWSSHRTANPNYPLVPDRPSLHRLPSGEALGSAGQPPNSATEPASEFLEEQRGRVRRLLHLLGVFAQLKESTGVERATLTSMLAFRRQDDANLLVNDVVLEVENQRRQLDELHTHVRPGPLRNLVFELVAMGPELRQVQESLLNSFSLDGLRDQFNADRLWDIMTLYIDKLHSLELLIVEEVEAARDRVVDAVPAPAGDISLGDGGWKGAFGVSASGTADDVRKAIEGLPADDVKKRLVAALQQKAPPPAAGPTALLQALDDRAKKGVDDLLKELCSAPASKEWEIDIYELQFLKRIGQGSAGTTYIADWSGLKVAVKVASITEMGLEGWRTEVQSLQKLHHPNIIRLLGSVYHPHPLTFCLVLEYCDGGDLQTALLKVTPGNFFFHVASSIAKGVAYLHNRSIIHRDIKPSNVLLHGDMSTGHYQVKVTDFGVATDLNSGRDRTAETGTYRWMSPEVIRHEDYSQTADVYSYAILVWQLLTREEPFADKSQIEAAIGVSMHSARPPLPLGTPDSVTNLLHKSWADKPHLRPSFEEISEILTDIEAGLTDDERRWLEAPLGHHVYKRLMDQYNSGVEIVKPPVELEHPKQLPVKDANAAKKRGKKFSLFSRKSSHF